jgi:hypothetical protein
LLLQPLKNTHYFLYPFYHFITSEDVGKPERKGLIRKLSDLVMTNKLTPEEKEEKARKQRREHIDSLKLMTGAKPGAPQAAPGSSWKPREDHPMLSEKK